MRPLLLCVAVVMAVPVSAQDADAKKALEAKYAQLVTLIKKKDAKGIFALGTKNFTWKRSSGQVLAGKQAEDVMSQELKQMPDLKALKIVITNVAVKGDTAVVNTATTMQLEMKDAQGKKHVIDESSTGKDTWKKVGNDWKALRTEDGQSQVKVDGKLQPAPQAQPLTPATPGASGKPGKKG